MSAPKQRIEDLGKRLFALKQKKADLEEQLAACIADIKDVAENQLPRLMQDTEVERLSLTGLGTVYLSSELYTNVRKDDRPKLYAWMRKEGHGDMIQDYVFPQTLTAFAREQIRAGQALPTEIQVSHIPTAKTRRT